MIENIIFNSRFSYSIINYFRWLNYIINCWSCYILVQNSSDTKVITVIIIEVIINTIDVLLFPIWSAFWHLLLNKLE